MNAWEAYVEYFRNFQPILADMSRRGLPISEEKRLALQTVIEGEDARATESIKALVPPEVLQGKQKLGYKRPPLLKCDECGEKFRTDHWCPLPPSTDEDGIATEGGQEHILYASLAEENGLVLREVTLDKEEKCRCTKKARPECDVCAGTGIIPAGLCESRWMALTEFNPNSSHQVKRFMRFLKHPIPKHAKRTDSQGESAETTEVKELERLYAKTKHPIYPLLIEKRQLSKIQGTYVDGWRPGRDGRIHTTYTFKPATWQTSSRSPCIQNGLKHGKTPFQKKLSKAFNAMQAAEPGHVMVNVDAKSFHAQTTACEAGLPDYLRLAKIDIHSFVTCHYLKMPERIGLLERPDEEMRAIFKQMKKDEHFKFIRDYKAKRCIAEGELVLTDRGLVAIQNVSPDMKVWDGVEWVHHEGLIDQGVREVITYQGLTATADHKVFTESGECKTLLETARRLDRLLTTGVAGQAIRTCHRDRLESSASERIREAQNQMPHLWRGRDSRLSFAPLWEGQWMSALRTNQVTAPRRSRKALRRHNLPLLLSKQSQVSQLWRQGHNLQIREPQRLCAVRGEGVAAPELQGCRDRSDRQQRSLRGRQSSTCHSQGESGQSQHHGIRTNRERSSSSNGLRLSLSLHMDWQVSAEAWHDGTADHRVCQGTRAQRQSQNVAEVEGVARFARTYDLANAGPRKCFTVSGRLVANCILGIQFAMFHRKLYQLNPDDFDSPKEAQALWELIMIQLFPGLKKWQDRMRAKAAEDKCLTSRFGAVRRFHDVQRWSRKDQKFISGEQAEAAVAFLPAANAFGMVRDMMIRMREKGFDERYQLVNSIHDSFVFHCPSERLEECIVNVQREVSAPNGGMVYPGVTGPEGLSVEAEASYGPNLAEMVEWAG